MELEHNLDSQMFKRDAEQAEIWIAMRESLLGSDDIGVSLHTVYLVLCNNAHQTTQSAYRMSHQVCTHAADKSSSGSSCIVSCALKRDQTDRRMFLCKHFKQTTIGSVIPIFVYTYPYKMELYYTLKQCYLLTLNVPTNKSLKNWEFRLKALLSYATGFVIGYP